MLYPIQNEVRSVMELNGIWDVSIERQSVSGSNMPLTDCFKVYVPGSINDQVRDEKIRNHVGDFWYRREVYVPNYLFSQRIVLRFGSVTQRADVYVNGKQVFSHIGGFTPFEFELNKYIRVGKNELEVKVSNILDNTTLPVGYHLKTEDKEEVIPMFDFYNYCGIHRSVVLYTTNDTYIKDIDINYQIKENYAMVLPKVEIVGDYDNIIYEILDDTENVVSASDDIHNLLVDSPRLWQPMNAYLYTLRVKVFSNGHLVDIYSEKFGIRTIEIKNNQLLINGKSYYLKGFGRHEDFPVLGKGHNGAVTILDHNLMKWMGANSYRTSHYPYAEEDLRLADEEGFLVIDEAPGVGLYSRFNFDVSKNNADNSTWSWVQTQEHHKQVIQELVTRDKNHPSVIAWAIANEPAGHHPGACEYFKPLVELTKSLDYEHRPVVVPNIVNATPELDEITKLVDIICLNRYYGWYIDHGNLNESLEKLKKEIETWHEKYPDKPIMFSEFGVDTVPGLHSLYENPYSEEYQRDYYQAYFDVFDEYSYVIGEHLWNFADFVTGRNLRRIDGNLKGIFTRDRRPKSVAYDIRKRWTSMD